MFKFSELFKHSVKYPAKIQEIHKVVDMSSEKALEEARLILYDLESKNISKAERLEKLGFTGLEGVIELVEVKRKKQHYQNLRMAIEKYQSMYPLNKFITKDEAKSVCEKYNLYIGDVPFFKGFVPERNLAEMERFVSNYGLVQYFKRVMNGPYHDSELVDKHEYENQTPGFLYYEHTPIFKIMAPENQFHITNSMRKVGREIIDDPIVLLPVTEGYIVITAWGDEASDPIIVNEGNN